MTRKEEEMEGVSVLIPALNEEKSIGKLIDEVKAVLNQAGRTYEIIAIDDGSDDKTYEIIQGKDVRALRHPAPGGYGLSLRDGINASQFNHIVIIDADGTYPAEKISELVDGLGEYDMVVGARTGEHYKESLLKYGLRIVLKTVCEFVAGRRIPDVNSGFRAFKKDVALKFQENFCMGFSFTTTITLAFHLNGHFVKYVPIEYHARKGRRSHVKILRDGLRTAQIITQAILYYNPIKLFLLLAFLAFTGAVIVLAAYYANGALFPLILGAVFLLSSFIYFGMGLVTAEMRNSQRR